MGGDAVKVRNGGLAMRMAGEEFATQYVWLQSDADEIGAFLEHRRIGMIIGAEKFAEMADALIDRLRAESEEMQSQLQRGQRSVFMTHAVHAQLEQLRREALIQILQIFNAVLKAAAVRRC